MDGDDVCLCGRALTSSDQCDDFRCYPAVECSRTGCVDKKNPMCPDCFTKHVQEVHGLQIMSQG